MHLLEIILLVVLVAMPVYTALTFKRNRQLMLDGVLTKTTAYKQTIVFLWVPTTIIISLIWFSPLTFAALGLTLTLSFTELMGSLLLLILLLIGGWNIFTIQRDVETHEPYLKAFEPLGWFLPKTKSEWRLLVLGVSPTAGICEELIFRGYLIWLLQPHTGMLGAVILSSVLFGLNHIYQGWGGVIKTGLTGLVLACVYWLTGSLWLPILLHTFIDVFSGTQAYLVLREQKNNQHRMDSQTQSGI